MRKIFSIAAVALALSPVLWAQESQDRQNQDRSAPTLPPEVVGPALVVWSATQQPRPILQDFQPKQPCTESFIGIVTLDSGKYLLRVSEVAVYQLSDQAIAKNYAGKQVRVAGSLDVQNNVLAIADIEAIS
jgi:hypothetical protein